MEIAVPKDAKDNPHTLLRRLGYGVERNRRTGEESYARRLAGAPFPRFHAYVASALTGPPSPLPSPSSAELGGRREHTLRLHLDQKAPSYEGSHAHSGEYEGALVEQEGARIKAFIARYRNEA